MRTPTKIFLVLLICFGMTEVFSPLSAAAEESQALHLLMALDISGSMRHTDPSRLLPKAATIVVNLLDSSDHLGILAFEGTTKMLLTPAPLDADRRRQGIRELQALCPRGPYTDLYTVLAEALKTFAADPAEHRALLLITDGQMDVDPKKGDSAAFSTRLVREIIPQYAQAKIPIYTVAFTTRSDQELLKSMAAATGGRFLLTPSAREVHLAFTWLYENLKHPQTAPIIGDRFLIDPSVAEAVLIAGRAQMWQAVTLTNPNGNHLTQKNHPPNLRWFAAPAFDLVTITQPQPGFWTISGGASGEGKVVLMTDLKLICPLLPADFGADEAPLVGAALVDKGKSVTTSELLENTRFSAELRFENQDPLTLELTPPLSEQRDIWPPGTMVGRFPPFHYTGQAIIKVTAKSKTFQREQTCTLPVSLPWYKVGMDPGAAGKTASLVCQPSPGRRLKQVWGWLSIQPPAGVVAVNFLKPPDEAEFICPLTAASPGPHVVDLRLMGLSSDGRPLSLQPGPWRLDLTASAAPPKPRPIGAPFSLGSWLPRLSSLRVSLPSLSRHWFWLAVALVMIASLTSLALPFYLRRARRPSVEAGEKTALISGADAKGSAEQLNLLLKAQVETLEKERLELKAAVGELRQQLDTLTSEKSQLVEELERLARSSQQHVKVISELEKRLELAEGEAKSVQTEYMNLFARNAEEKKTLAKE